MAAVTLRHVVLSVSVFALTTGPIAPMRAQSAAGGRVTVCPLVSKAEVKKHLPWRDMLDQFAPEKTRLR